MGLVIYLCMLCVSFSAPLPPVSAVTPLVAEQFAWELRFHPQRPQVDFVLDGIRHGFKLGFSPSQKLKSAKKNKPSATQHASVIDAYLANEVSLGRVAGPFHSPLFPNLQVSSFGVIPRPGPIYPSLLCFCPSTVYFLLSSAGEVTSLRVTLPGR